jgi:hypothetical protein
MTATETEIREAFEAVLAAFAITEHWYGVLFRYIDRGGGPELLAIETSLDQARDAYRDAEARYFELER